MHANDGAHHHGGVWRVLTEVALTNSPWMSIVDLSFLLHHVSGDGDRRQLQALGWELRGE